MRLGIRDVQRLLLGVKEGDGSSIEEVCSYCVAGLILVAYGSDLWHRGEEI